jgi:hypothetical protein
MSPHKRARSAPSCNHCGLQVREGTIFAPHSVAPFCMLLPEVQLMGSCAGCSEFFRREDAVEGLVDKRPGATALPCQSSGSGLDAGPERFAW